MSTAGESVFEDFCRINLIPCRRINEQAASTPDYEIVLGKTAVYVEIKDIQEDENFGTPVQTRTVGSHVRAKIGEAKAQLQPPARAGAPTILLIYNALDPFQAFGTEQHDFLAAMYGELTVSIDLDTRAVSDSFHGRNRSLAPGKNTSFSAVGAIHTRGSKTAVVLYENAFAKNPLDYSSLPTCFEAKLVAIAEA